jgi:hypothetical protein
MLSGRSVLPRCDGGKSQRVKVSNNFLIAMRRLPGYLQTLGSLCIGANGPCMPAHSPAPAAVLRFVVTVFIAPTLLCHVCPVSGHEAGACICGVREMIRQPQLHLLLPPHGLQAAPLLPRLLRRRRKREEMGSTSSNVRF